MAPVTQPAASPSYQATLERARSMRKADLVPAPETLAARETLSAATSAPVKAVVLAVPANPSAGLAMAIADMKRYFETVTGKPVQTVVMKPGAPLTMPAMSTNDTAAGRIFCDSKMPASTSSLGSGTPTTPTFGSIVAKG